MWIAISAEERARPAPASAMDVAARRTPLPPRPEGWQA